MAAVLACGTGAVLSHGRAGQLFGFVPRRERFALHVSLTAGADRGPRGTVTHRPRRLDKRDTTIRNRIPVTTATRTVWDLATIFSPLRTRRAFEQAEKLDLLDRTRLASLLAASGTSKGVATLRELLAEQPLPLALTRSRLEEILLETCRDHGLQLPAVRSRCSATKSTSPGRRRGSSSRPTAATTSSRGSAIAATSATRGSHAPAISFAATRGERFTTAPRSGSRSPRSSASGSLREPAPAAL